MQKIKNKKYRLLSKILKFSPLLIFIFVLIFSALIINQAKAIVGTGADNDNNPIIDSFSPTSGKEGDAVLISGNNFNGLQYVLFGELAQATATESSDMLIKVKVPRVAVTGYIHVVTDHGQAVSEEEFTVIPSSSVNTNDTCSNGATNYPDCNNNNTNTSGNSSLIKKEFSGIVPVCNSNIGSDGMYTDPCNFNYVMLLINQVIKFLLFIIATPLFALIIIYVGWLYLSAGGNSENVTKAKKIIKNALIGYIIALIAWLLIKMIMTTLGFNGENYLDY